jgi:ankyrin repeat protein
VNRTDANGWAAPMCAAAGDAAIVERLIEAGAATEATASDGMTALKRATASRHAAVVDMIENETRIRAELG